MRATLTTTPQYALMKEQLQKEIWTPYTWNFANSKCGGGMWVPQSKFLSQSISYLGIGVCPRILLYRKLKKKWEELPWWQHWVFINKNTVVSTLNVLLLTLNEALPGGRLRITRFMLMPIPLWIKLNHASCSLYLSLYALVWMYLAASIHRPFKSSMVLGLKCLLRSNWHGVKFD